MRNSITCYRVFPSLSHLHPILLILLIHSWILQRYVICLIHHWCYSWVSSLRSSFKQRERIWIHQLVCCLDKISKWINLRKKNLCELTVFKHCQSTAGKGQWEEQFCSALVIMGRTSVNSASQHVWSGNKRASWDLQKSFPSDLLLPATLSDKILNWSNSVYTCISK